MIQRMQRRLTTVLLLFLVSVYVGLCSTSYFAGMRSIQEDSAVIFDRVMEPRPPEDELHRVPGQIGVPYFMVFLDRSGALIDSALGQFELSDEELGNIAQKALEQGQESGYLKEYSLRFHLRETPIGYQLMFTDESVREQAQRR